MSLDVRLIRKYHVSYDGCKTWEEREEELYWANITHNLNTMADRAGIYEALWHPEDIGAKYAEDIIKIVSDGLLKLRADQDYFEQFNA